MDIERLLQPVGPQDPCGPALDEEPVFLVDFAQAAQGRPEREMGSSVLPAQPPDWKEVLRQAPALLSRSKDLRVAVALAEARTALEGPEGLAEGLALIDGLVRAYWAEVHPRLDADDNNDPTERMNALAPLADASRLLRTLRHSRLAMVPAFGPLSVRQAEAALGVLQPAAGEAALPAEQLGPMIAAAAASGRIDGAARALEAAQSLAEWLNQRVGADRATDLQPLIVRLRPLAALVQRHGTTGAPAVEAVRADSQAAVPGTPAAPAPAAAAAGAELRSRDDARRLLERVAEFLEAGEPSNPAPLLIRRAIRLLSMSFLDIVRDLAPDSLGAVEHIAGAARTASDTDS